MAEGEKLIIKHTNNNKCNTMHSAHTHTHLDSVIENRTIASIKYVLMAIKNCFIFWNETSINSHIHGTN